MVSYFLSDFIDTNTFVHHCLGKIDAISSIINNFGQFGSFCIIPIVFLAYVAFKTRSGDFFFPTVLAVGALAIYIVLRVFLKSNIDDVSQIICISAFYGLVCVCSCFQGLKMRTDLFNNSLLYLKDMYILISFILFISLFILERFYGSGALSNQNSEKAIRYGVFMVCLTFLILQLSFFYVTLGYSSKDKDRINPIVFLATIGFCFSLGLTSSVFVLYFGKIITEGCLITSHWPFICVWAVFISTTCLALSEDTLGILGIFQQFLRSFIGDTNKKQKT